MTEALQVVTTTESQAEAEALAGALVSRRLAACVQVIGPIRSVYRWEGQVTAADEWLCQIKTTRAGYSALEAAIRELHAYDVPEIIATPTVAGSEAYLGWVGETVNPVDD
jgi:periplasmic divalent cation tolerance protein